MTAAAPSDIRVAGGDWPVRATLAKLVEDAIAATSTTAPGFPTDRHVSVLFTNDDDIARLNAAWRSEEGPTNVLSFPAAEIPGNGAEPASLGDLALGFETVIKEAAASHLTVGEHISHLLVHGLLHLAGYDHAGDEQAEAMEAIEVAILGKLGIADPYAGSEPETTVSAGS
jgi:probable rRNA maturation factor